MKLRDTHTVAYLCTQPIATPTVLLVWVCVCVVCLQCTKAVTIFSRLHYVRLHKCWKCVWWSEVLWVMSINHKSVYQLVPMTSSRQSTGYEVIMEHFLAPCRGCEAEIKTQAAHLLHCTIYYWLITLRCLSCFVLFSENCMVAHIYPLNLKVEPGDS